MSVCESGCFSFSTSIWSRSTFLRDLAITLHTCTQLLSWYCHTACGKNFAMFEFLKGNRKQSVIHARIRNNCSDLKSDLYNNHLSLDRSCSCGNPNESALRFFFECENYSQARIRLFRETRPVHPLSLNYVLYGKSISSNLRRAPVRRIYLRLFL